MADQMPRLMRGGLSGIVYVVTKYNDLGNGSIEAIVKYDVHNDFMALVQPVSHGFDCKCECDTR